MGAILAAAAGWYAPDYPIASGLAFLVAWTLCSYELTIR